MMENNAGSLLFGLWAEDMHLRMDGFFGKSGMRIGSGGGSSGELGKEGCPAGSGERRSEGASFTGWEDQAGVKAVGGKKIFY